MELTPGQTLKNLPLFPLPDFFLLPGVLAPLHIFETRYRKMIDDLLDRSGRLVIAAYGSAAERTERGPEVFRVGGLAEIVHHERLEDGRYVLMVLGLARVAMTEHDTDRPYRRVDAMVLPEIEPEEERGDALKDQLVAALIHRTGGKFNAVEVGEAGTVSRLADLLLSALPLQADRVARAFEETDIGARAELALAWHDETAGAGGAD